MKTVLVAADDIAFQAARHVGAIARAAIADRGRALLAFSGGRTPGTMLHALAEQPLPWPQIEVFQVDERVAPAGDPARNLMTLHEALSGKVAPAQLHAMPVETSDLDEAARRYAGELQHFGGVFDLVHLGLGDDGHTASLVPGDPVLEAEDRDVAVSGPYQGHRRLTLTFPALNRAANVLWLVTGAGKAAMVQRLYHGDRSIPAGRVQSQNAVLIADDAAGAMLPTV